MNQHKIAFITCVNDPSTYEECLLYLDALAIPQGWDFEVLSIEHAHSMTSGYNRAMRQSDAKFKIYLHQDVYLCHREILLDLICIFEQDPQIGLIGLAGCKTLPASGIWWESNDIYENIAQILSPENLSVFQMGNMEHTWQDMEIVDGFFIATQYDIPWEEGVFTGWHFYDVSHCINFRKQGLRIVVPKQPHPWCIHECGAKELDKDYLHWREVFRQWNTCGTSPSQVPASI